jgi:hypothetical protein
MKKITVPPVCVLVVAVSWLGWFGSEAGKPISPAGGYLDCRLAAAPADLGGAQVPQDDSISPATATTGVATQAGLTQPHVSYPRVSLKGEVGFDHLVADTSSGEAMAPQKSDTAETGATRSR